MTAAAPIVVARVGGERVGFAVSAVREVVPVERVAEVPAALAALRGVMPVRERYVSVVSLAALLAGDPAPAAPAPWAVLVRVGEGSQATDVALEVDEVEAVVERGAVVAATGPGAAGPGEGRVVWRWGDALVTVLDATALGERMAGIAEGRP